MGLGLFKLQVLRSALYHVSSSGQIELSISLTHQTILHNIMDASQIH